MRRERCCRVRSGRGREASRGRPAIHRGGSLARVAKTTGFATRLSLSERCRYVQNFSFSVLQPPASSLIREERFESLKQPGNRHHLIGHQLEGCK
jgi:hypothetical protein